MSNYKHFKFQSDSINTKEVTKIEDGNEGL